MDNPFWEQQKQLFNMWNEGLKKMPGMEAYQNMASDPTEYWKKYTEMIPNVAEYWKKFAEFMPGADSYWKNMTGFMPSPDAWMKNMTGFMPSSDMWTKMWSYSIPGMDVYTKVFDLWKGMGDPMTFMQNYQEKYTDLMQDVIKNFLPAGSAQFFSKSQELTQTCVDFYKDILSPWMKIDESIMDRIAAGDRYAYKDFFKDFHAKYEETFGKLFNMMGMGVNRETNEDQMNALSSYIKMLFISAELAGLVNDACIDSMQALVERFQEDMKEGKAVTTFREFYKLWYTVTEEVLLKLFNTDEFSKVFGDFADKYGQYMIATNKVYERMLAPYPIPTKKDMDSLYKTVYDLRKEVRDLRRQLEGMKEEPAKK